MEIKVQKAFKLQVIIRYIFPNLLFLNLYLGHPPWKSMESISMDLLKRFKSKQWTTHEGSL